MRRRKKDKAHQEKASTSSTDHDAMDSSGRSGSSAKATKDTDAASGGVTVTVSPPPPRSRRSLLGSLGSMRDLVEQVIIRRGHARGCLVLVCVSVARIVSFISAAGPGRGRESKSAKQLRSRLISAVDADQGDLGREGISRCSFECASL